MLCLDCEFCVDREQWPDGLSHRLLHSNQPLHLMIRAFSATNQLHCRPSQNDIHHAYSQDHGKRKCCTTNYMMCYQHPLHWEREAAVIKEHPCTSGLSVLGLVISSGRIACRLRSGIWQLASSTRVAQLAKTITLDMLEKILIVNTFTSATNILLECSHHALARKLGLLVLRIRLFGHGELLERTIWLFVTKATL